MVSGVLIRFRSPIRALPDVTISVRSNMEFDLPHPHLLFLGEETAERHAKTAFGLLDWAPRTLRRENMHCLGRQSRQEYLG